ncbi:hypothetical protein C5167_024436 [Papaver somniferum]|uniref:VHS domain-containing protein n=1 Tax=Papaver somniferum TaxID=3469 RepID=A0A4Y7JNK0_PAPSO|nr:TOM1-like protein 5 [Papaver somniferum]RZC62674.1 hypothetical protein C5167_024436 [Papaver somniferum]
MASELVNLATSEKLTEMDWIKNIEICELVAHDQGEARDVIKVITRRLGDKNSNVQLYTVMLLEVLINNCGEHIHRHVLDMGILPILVKIVKKKKDLPVRENICRLLHATQASLGGALGKFPQYYAAYSELVNAGIQFPQRPTISPVDPTPVAPNGSLSQVKPLSPNRKGVVAQQSGSQNSSESSIIQKAGAALDVLRDVLDAIDTRRPEGANDEFTLDLVEQCSFQKQRVMHLVLTCRNENVVSQAIELNDQLEKVLVKHDTLLAVRAASISNPFVCEEMEEEDQEEQAYQLVRRMRKGKACVRPEEGHHKEKASASLLGKIEHERLLHRPLIRPTTSSEQKESVSEPPLPPPAAATIIPLPPPAAATIIPPPPAKRVERERFFQEKQVVDGTELEDHVASISLQGKNSTN